MQETWDVGSIPGLGRSPGGGLGSPLQYSCLENPKGRGAWWATVRQVIESYMTEAAQHACMHTVFSIHLLIHIDFWHLGRLGISQLLALCKQILEMSVDVGMSGKWQGSRRPEEREVGGQGYLFLRDGRDGVLTSGNTEGGVTLREYGPVFLLTASKLFCFSLLKALGFAAQGSIV